MLFAIALLAAAPGAAAPYPATEVLSAFESACSRLNSLDEATRAIEEAQWTAFVPETGSPLDLMTAEAADLIGSENYQGAAFRKTLAGRQLELALSEAPGFGEPGIVRQCKIYDFTATGPIERTLAETWIGRPTDEYFGGQEPVMISMVWLPGIADGHDQTSISYWPAANEFGGTLDIGGISLLTRVAVGGGEE